ncbi:Sugar phosphate permease [Burkholderia sp. GAS332]|nr:Sugar phosphate permease [Burkholderia sp. GAS332]
MEEILAKAYRKIDVRVLLLIAICYALAVLDKTNIAFAKLQMQSDIGLSDSQYGIAAGIFFIGYALFEIPSNLLLPKVGARKTIARILVLWGLTSASISMVRDVHTFYALRFLLGIFEAGFAPGAIFFLTYWYAEARMGRAVALLLCAGPVASALGGPLSGWLLNTFSGLHGLVGWQWMFIIEGIPSALMGLVVLATLPDRPSKASWLTTGEKKALDNVIEVHNPQHRFFFDVLQDPKIHIMAAAYFCLICGMYFVNFWLPTVLSAANGLSVMEIGILSGIPYLVGACAMVLVGRHSDSRRERRWHSVVPAFLAAAFTVIAGAFLGDLVPSLIWITLATAAMYSSYTVFWAIPSQHLKGDAASGGIAYINTVGLIGGFVSPTVVGYLKDWTGSLYCGMMAMSLLLAIAAVILLRINPPNPELNEVKV